MWNKNSSRAKLLVGNLRVAPACGPPLSLPANKHPYLFSLGRIAAEATSPCRREITSYQWRLSPGQGSRVGGGIRVAEQQSGKETVCQGQSGKAVSTLMEYLAQSLTTFHQFGLICEREMADCQWTLVLSPLGWRGDWVKIFRRGRVEVTESGFLSTEGHPPGGIVSFLQLQ